MKTQPALMIGRCVAMIANAVIVAFSLSGCSDLNASSVDGEEIVYPEGFSKLVFSDEFNYHGLPDSTKWNYEEGYVRNGEMQFYTKGRNAWCTDSTLVMEARHDFYVNNGDTCPVTSSSLTTLGKGEWETCFVEVRARIPSFRGSWPAIWMMPAESRFGEWPKSGEIDIVEHVGYEPENIHFAAHSERYNHMRGEQKNKKHYAPEATDGYHTYGFKHSPDELVWFFDNQKVFSLSKDGDADWTTWPYDSKFYLILNLAVGGGWGGLHGVDLSALPARYEIDYVRVFQ